MVIGGGHKISSNIEVMQSLQKGRVTPFQAARENLELLNQAK